MTWRDPAQRRAVFRALARLEPGPERDRLIREALDCFARLEAAAEAIEREQAEELALACGRSKP